MNLRTLLVKTCILSLLGTVLIVGGCAGNEETGVADEPNTGPGEPPGKPADAKVPTAPPSKAAPKK